jgi:exopolysaccharide production protein ExoZ
MAQDCLYLPHKLHEGRRLDNIQLLRALAALSVVLAHALHETGNYEYALNLGYGVDVFFVISGFIMAHTSLREFGKPGASLRFFARRLARVAPLYWLLTTLMLLASMVLPSLLNVPTGGIGHILASYLFIPDARGVGEMRPVLALGWTLNYEMFFYTLLSLAMFLPARRGFAWLSALILLLVLLGTLISFGDHPRISFLTNPILLEFLAGVFVALLYERGLRVNGRLTLILWGFGLLGFFPRQLSSEPDFWRATMCGLPAVLFVMAATIGTISTKGRLTTFGLAVGDASYSLYLAHPFVLRPLRVLWLKAVGPHLDFLFVVLTVLGAVVVALALYRSIERPLSGWLQESLKRDASAVPNRMKLALRRAAVDVSPST